MDCRPCRAVLPHPEAGGVVGLQKARVVHHTAVGAVMHVRHPAFAPVHAPVCMMNLDKTTKSAFWRTEGQVPTVVEKSARCVCRGGEGLRGSGAPIRHCRMDPSWVNLHNKCTEPLVSPREESTVPSTSTCFPCVSVWAIHTGGDRVLVACGDVVPVAMPVKRRLVRVRLSNIAVTYAR